MLFSIQFIHAQSPTLTWAKQLGSTSNDYGNSVFVDASGNVYTSGSFQGTVDFDPGAGVSNLTSAGSDDIFVSKLDASGNFVWAKAMGGTSADASKSILIDASGNVYTTGLFRGTCDFDPGAGVSNLTSAGTDEIFISKLDASGNFLWAKRIGGTSGDRGLSIVVDGSGNVYTTGYFQGTVDFDPGAGVSNLTSAGSYDIFISKLNSSGTFVWAKAIGSTYDEQGTSIALDASGNVYTTGFFTINTVDFDPGAGVSNLTPAGSADAFVLKLDASGNYVWAKAMGGTSFDPGYSIKLDGSGNVYTTGNFQGTADFDPGAGVSNLTSAGGDDIFISKLDGSGNFVWAKAVGGTSTDNATSIAIDASGNSYTSGYFGGTCDFDPSASVFNITAGASQEGFTFKLDASGNFAWAQNISGTFGVSQIQVLSNAIDASGNIYTAGFFVGTCDFDPASCVVSNLTPVGATDVFVDKKTPACPTVSLTISSSTNVLCNGAATGAASFTPSGGSCFSYTWSPSGGSAASASGLVANTYSCTVANSCGSTTTKTVTITQPFALTTTTAVTNVLCNGGSTGSATISASGGTGSYTYLWSTGATTSVIASQLAGAYSATVTDANSCTSIKNATIAQPSVLVSTITSTNTACLTNNGSAAVAPSGGTGSYTYSWSPSGATTATATGLGVGLYSCVIKDANLCSLTKTVNVTTSGAPTATITAQSNVTCNGTCNGSATLTASGGSAPYNYSWSNGSTTPIITGLCAGSYTCTVTGSNGCSVIISVTITQPTVLSANATASSILCNGGVSTVTVTATGGTTAYTGVGTFTATAGIKTYTITDANSCSTTTSISITQPSILSASSSASSILCNGGVSTITVSATGGTTAYTGVGTFTAMAGTKTYTITDANSCSTTTSISITQPSVLSASSSASSILCNGGVSTITVTATGGTTAYTGVGTFTAMAGTQTYTITDANSCLVTTSVSILEPTALVANSTASSILCNGGVSTVTVTATGGTTAYTGVGIFTAMAGIKTYTITDANSCSTTTSVSISEPTVLVANSTASSILCNGGVSTITVTATGGTTAYTGVGTFTAIAGTQTYTITDSNSCSTTTSVSISEPAAIVSSQTVALCSGQSVTVGTNTYTSAGTYTDVIAAQNTCDSTVTTVVIINPLPTITVNSGAICAGQSFTMAPSGASTYTYSSGTAIVSPTADATYSVSGTDANGCLSLTDAVSSVTVNALPSIMATTNNTLLCTGQTASLTVTGASTYTWSTTENNATIAVSPTVQTTYTVDGTDANGCVNTTTVMQDVSLCTGINSQLVNPSSQIVMYPNPTNGILNIVLSSVNEKTTIQIVNALGQVLINEKVLGENSTIDLSNLPTGMYFVNVLENNTAIKTQKIVKQ